MSYRDREYPNVEGLNDPTLWLDHANAIEILQYDYANFINPQLSSAKRVHERLGLSTDTFTLLLRSSGGEVITIADANIGKNIPVVSVGYFSNVNSHSPDVLSPDYGINDADLKISYLLDPAEYSIIPENYLLELCSRSRFIHERYNTLSIQHRLSSQAWTRFGSMAINGNIIGIQYGKLSS